jgi:hypothetical protein
MTLRAVVFALIAVAPTAAVLHAQTNTFDIVSDGKVVGKSTYTIAKAKQGFRLQGRTTYVIRPVEARATDDIRLSDNYGFLQGSITDQNSQTVYSYLPDKSRTTLTVGTIQAGAMDSHSLPIKPDAAFMPSFDAGAAQVMLLLALTHPTSNNLYNAIVPGNAGHAPKQYDPKSVEAETPDRRPGDNAYDVLWAKGSDATGTLDGKPVNLHSYTLTGKVSWTFYADDQNNLMQVDSSQDKASCIRANFKLGGS